MKTELYNSRKGAREYVGRMIEKGAMERPKACETCGKEAEIEAHHYLGYAKKNWKKVHWLCTGCHGEAHRNKNKMEMIMTRVGLTDEEYRDLRMISLATSTPLAELIGDILRKWLKRKLNKDALPVDGNDESEDIDVTLLTNKHL